MATTLLDRYIKAGHRVHRPDEVRRAKKMLSEGAMAGKPEAFILGTALVFEKLWLGLTWMAQEWAKVQVAQMLGTEHAQLAEQGFRDASGVVLDEAGVIVTNLWHLHGDQGEGDFSLSGFHAAIFDGIRAAWGLQSMSPFQNLS